MTTLSVIVPAYRCARMLDRCLLGLLASDVERGSWQLIVVDDGSNDETATVARNRGAEVVTITDGPRGPAFARNRGVELATGDIVVFVDADVVVSPTTLSQFAQLFRSSVEISAAFGSYDSAPDDPGFVSQYRNLQHHWIHHRDPGPASTFWAGCGAVRRNAFHGVHGFDADRYPRPQIEDIDLGYRLTDAGHRIVLDPRIQGTHLKRWTLHSMLRADLYDRAIPWMQLLLDRQATFSNGPLNLRRSEQLLTALVGLATLCAMIGLLLRTPAWLLVSGACLIVVVTANARLLLWLSRVRSPVFALCAVPLRLLFYFISGGGAVAVLLRSRRRSTRAHVRPLGNAPGTATR